jgi:tripartite-type tricarboxylate transporter receptor subunit TctC
VHHERAIRRPLPAGGHRRSLRASIAAKATHNFGEDIFMARISIRNALCAGFGAVVILAANTPAQAQYPERAITLIVPYGAGGGTDITARMLAKDLEAVLGKPVTVENRAGGGGWVGWGSLAQAAPDGYTIGYLNVPSMYAGYLDKQYNRKETLDSFTPLMNHVIDYNVWAVKADSPFKSVKDIVEAAKKTPDTISISAFGAGSDDHLAILSMQRENCIKLITVHHKSTADAKTGALGGHLQVLGANISEVAEEARAGTIRVLGVMSPERSPFLPNTSTFKEQGFNQVWSVSRGIAAPAGLPKEVQDKLTTALEKTLTSPEHQQKAKQLSLEPRVIKGDDYKTFLKDNEVSTKTLMGW